MNHGEMDFVSGGYLITRPVARPPYVSAELLPPSIVSASHCIAKFVPDSWCIEWAAGTPTERLDGAREFELGEDLLHAVTAWVAPLLGREIGFPNVCLRLDTAVDLATRFLGHLPDVRILELAIHRSKVERFCAEAEPPPSPPGFAPTGRQGVHEAILQGRAPERDGNVLGFEPLVFDRSLSCSWLCNGLERLVADTLGIQPNRHGLIERWEDARRITESISRDGVGAEPGLWLPWRLSQIPAS